MWNYKMSQDKYYLGIDGGGTKTIGCVADHEGHIVAHGIGGSINYYAIGMNEAIRNFDLLLAELKEKLNISEFDTIYIGSSALEREATKQEIREFAVQSSTNSIFMHSDVFTGLMGLTLGRPGVLVISGTGSIAAAFDNYGGFHTVGGWGHILGDEGSAYDISLKAIKAAIKGYEGIGPFTNLIQYVQEYFKVIQLKDLINNFYEKGVPRHDVAGFAKCVDHCAEAGDFVGLHILQKAAFDLTCLGRRFLKDFHQPDPIVGIYGGVMKNSKITRNSFIENIKLYFPEARVLYPEFPPEIGAIYLCFFANHIPFDEKVVKNIKETYTDKLGGIIE